MAIAFVNRVGSGSTASDNKIDSAAQNVTAGNTLLAWFLHDPTAADSGLPTDTAGNSWTKLGSTQACLDGQSAYLYYVTNCLGNAANVLRLNLTASVVYRAASILQFSGCATVSLIDDNDAGTGTGTTASTPSLTISAAEAAVVMFGEANAAGWAAGSGYSQVAFNFTGDATNYLMNEYKIVTGNETPSATCASGNWNVLSAALKVAAAGTSNWGPLLGQQNNRIVRTF